MIPYPNIRPEIFRLGPVVVRWYGLMYVIGFVFGFHILKARIRAGYFKIPIEKADSFISHLVIGMLIGARLVYVFVYNWEYYSVRPVEILFIQQGGLSFHGALIGMVAAALLFARRYRVSRYSALDTLAIGACVGLFVGRFGNFINGELYGRVTDVPWAMVFPTDPKGLPRHPSQIYQAFTDGLFVFMSMSILHLKMKKSGVYREGRIGAMFLMSYGVFRFLVEFTREPDAQLGFVFSIFSMGQILCFITFVAGAVLWKIVDKTGTTYEVAKLKRLPNPQKLDFVDRYLWWPIEKFLARFVA